MDVLDQIEDLSAIQGPLHLAIGVFDGLHLGHQAVLEEANSGAKRSSGRVILVTFDPHPIRVLRPEEAPRILTNTRHKLRLAERLGIETAVIVRFDEAFSKRTGREFVEQLAATCGDLRQICVGRGWKFGSRRSGDLDLLRELGSELGFEASGAATVELDGAPVSSTRIREMIREGAFAEAAELLGRDCTVLGTVEEGQQLGRKLGFPTANLQVHNEQLPPSGVYVVRVEHEGDLLEGVANLGVRPTVTDQESQRKLEVHLFDYHGPELYGADLEVTFLKHLRPERRFNGIEELKQAIAGDVQDARDYLRD